MFFQTLQSLPNVSPFQNAAGPVNNFRTTSNSVTIGGSASGTTSYLQDGVTNIAMLTKTANFQPPIEATQEVSIIQNGASARYDEPSVVNVITKGGTNRFHGRAYDYFQNDALNTVGYFNRPKPPLLYNQFGANIGGPIVKNKHSRSTIPQPTTNKQAQSPHFRATSSVTGESLTLPISTWPTSLFLRGVRLTAITFRKAYRTRTRITLTWVGLTTS